VRALVATIGLLALLGCAEQNASGPRHAYAPFHPSAIAYWAALDTYVVRLTAGAAPALALLTRGFKAGRSSLVLSERFDEVRQAQPRRLANRYLFSAIAPAGELVWSQRDPRAARGFIVLTLPPRGGSG